MDHPASTAAPPPPASITAVVNGHREGLLIRSAISSARMALEQVRSAGVAGQMLVVLDRPDADTESLVRSMDDLDVRTVEFGDLAQSRNFAASVATTGFVAFLDADDLWDPNWLLRALRFHRALDEPAILHPEGVIHFGAGRGQQVQMSSRDPRFRRENLSFHNYWISQVVVDVQILRSHPYPPISLADGLGFEDWGWNCRTLAAGIAHLVVPGTLAFIRRRAGSLSISSLSSGAYPDYGGLFHGTVTAHH